MRLLIGITLQGISRTQSLEILLVVKFMFPEHGQGATEKENKRKSFEFKSVKTSSCLECFVTLGKRK